VISPVNKVDVSDVHIEAIQKEFIAKKNKHAITLQLIILRKFILFIVRILKIRRAAKGMAVM
jgi:hypothetical protein